MNSVYLGIGSNTGDRGQNLSDALLMINELVGNVLRRSSLYETEPWGFNSDNYFLNMAVVVLTGLDQHEVLKNSQHIEKQLGRIRTGKGYSDRIIDIDILLFNNLIIQERDLVIPHPLMHERKFVMAPMAEIAPDVIHPGFNLTMLELLESCPDNHNLKKLPSDLR
jgi:2-amino-4-hydroxy-6-hydroxymethyldihydropteridine diphosphokinase